MKKCIKIRVMLGVPNTPLVAHFSNSRALSILYTNAYIYIYIYYIMLTCVRRTVEIEVVSNLNQVLSLMSWSCCLSFPKNTCNGYRLSHCVSL